MKSDAGAGSIGYGAGAARTARALGRQPLRVVDPGAEAGQIQPQSIITQTGAAEPRAGAPSEAPSDLLMFVPRSRSTGRRLTSAASRRTLVREARRRRAAIRLEDADGPTTAPAIEVPP